MVAMLGSTEVEGKKINDLIKEGKIKKQKVEEIIERTKKGGAEIVKYLEKGSAFYAPAASGVEMAESYLKDQKKQLPCAAYLNGEYDTKNLYAGVPVIIGSKGVEKVVELKLSEEEKKILKTQLNQCKIYIMQQKKLTPHKINCLSGMKNKKYIILILVGSGLSSLMFADSFLKKNNKIDIISFIKNKTKYNQVDNKHIFKILPPQMIGEEKKLRLFFFK